MFYIVQPRKEDRRPMKTSQGQEWNIATNTTEIQMHIRPYKQLCSNDTENLEVN